MIFVEITLYFALIVMMYTVYYVMSGNRSSTTSHMIGVAWSFIVMCIVLYSASMEKTTENLYRSIFLISTSVSIIFSALRILDDKTEAVGKIEAFSIGLGFFICFRSVLLGITNPTVGYIIISTGVNFAWLMSDKIRVLEILSDEIDRIKCWRNMMKEKIKEKQHETAIRASVGHSHHPAPRQRKNRQQ